MDGEILIILSGLVFAVAYCVFAKSNILMVEKEADIETKIILNKNFHQIFDTA